MRRKRNDLKLILVILLLTISLGYAFLQTDLTINGTSKINATSWDIHFEDLTLNPNNVAPSTGDVAPTIDSTTRTDITYTVTLKEPGDFYEFEVAIVNSGTIDAMIGTITNKLNGNEISTTNPLPAYLSYTVAYNDGVAIAPNQLLEAGNSETIKVRLAFRTDIDPEDLPTEGATNTLSFGLSYIQADDNAVTRPEQIPDSVAFATDSWKTIIKAVQMNNTAVYHVGDTKLIELGNSLGTHTIRLANKSTPAECEANGFSQSACGFVLEFADSITTHRMNPFISGDTTTIPEGWEYSDMRAYLNSTVYAYENIDYSTTGIYSSLPKVLRDAIINTTVVTGHGINDTTNYITTDKLYLLSTHEVWEDEDFHDDVLITQRGISYQDAAYNNTRQLDYYENLGVSVGWDEGSFHGNFSNAIKQYDGTDDVWWLRASDNLENYHNFMKVFPTGSSGISTPSNIYGVSPAFRIG